MAKKSVESAPLVEVNGKLLSCHSCELFLNCQSPFIREDGALEAPLYLIGDAPGEYEDNEARPFSPNGKQGHFLRSKLQAIGIPEELCRFGNAVLCRPEKKPTDKQIKACKANIDLGGSKVVLLLGAAALKSVLGLAKITKYRGSVIERDGRFIIPTYHPSHVLRDMTQEELFTDDLMVAKGLLDGKKPEHDLGVYKLCTSLSDSIAVLQRALIEPRACLDFETTGVKYWKEDFKVVTLNISFQARESFIIPIEHPETPFVWGTAGWSILCDLICKILARKDLELFGHYVGFDGTVAYFKFGARILAKITDTITTQHLIDPTPGKLGLDYLTLKYAREMGRYWDPLEDYKREHLTEAEQGSYDKIPLFTHLGEYGGCDVDAPFRAYPKQMEILKSKVNADFLLNEVALKLPQVAIDLHINGLKVDTKYLDILEGVGDRTEEERKKSLPYKMVESLEKIWSAPEIQDWELKNRPAPPPPGSRAKQKTKEFNPNSPDQLRDIIYNTYHIPVTKLTDTGKPACNKEILKPLAEAYPLIQECINFKWLKKMNSTYVSKIRDHLDKDDIAHYSYNYCGTVSGRWSSPIHTVPKGTLIRSAYISRFPEGRLVVADLSQIELRVLACNVMSGDKALRDGFFKGQDPHKITASIVFGVPLDDVTKSQRDCCKTLNFAILYGRGPASIAVDLTIAQKRLVTKQEAIAFQAKYFARMPQVKAFIDREKDFLRKHGFSRNPNGRVRYLPNINSWDRELIEEACRQGVNYVIQSAASDITLWALIQVNNFIKENGLMAKLCLTVHDSIAVDSPPEEIELCTNLLREVMTHPPYEWMDVPCAVDVKAMRNLGEEPEKKDGKPEEPPKELEVEIEEEDISETQVPESEQDH
jgi:DNA polymerase I